METDELKDGFTNAELVECVQQYPVLWDCRHPQHKDNSVIRKSWLEIARVLNSTDCELKTRWRTLRDRYRKEIKKTRTTSGQATQYTPKWSLFAALEFLRPSMEPRKTISNIISPSMIESREYSEIDFDIVDLEPDTQMTLEVNEGLGASTSTDETALFSPSSSTSEPFTKRRLSPGPSKFRRVKPKIQTAEPDELERAILQHVQKPAEVKTAEELFYASIAKQVMCLTPQGRINVQMAVLQTISHEISKETEENKQV